jgi:hypothetical protein
MFREGELNFIHTEGQFQTCLSTHAAQDYERGKFI